MAKSKGSGRTAKGAMPPKRKPSKNSLSTNTTARSYAHDQERYNFKTGQMFKKK